jgi:hypothetical protein
MALKCRDSRPAIIVNVMRRKYEMRVLNILGTMIIGANVKLVISGIHPIEGCSLDLFVNSLRDITWSGVLIGSPPGLIAGFKSNSKKEIASISASFGKKLKNCINEFLKTDLNSIFAAASGCSVARYRATFGMWRPQVRILPSRRYQNKACRSLIYRLCCFTPNM